MKSNDEVMKAIKRIEDDLLELDHIICGSIARPKTLGKDHLLYLLKQAYTKQEEKLQAYRDVISEAVKMYQEDRKLKDNSKEDLRIYDTVLGVLYGIQNKIKGVK